MISSLRFLGGEWEKSKGILRDDLEQIQIAVNHLWAKAFGFEYLLKNGVIAGDGGVLKKGDDDDDEVTAVERLEFSDLPEISESHLVGRGQGLGDGDMEEIALGTGLLMTGTTLSVTVAASTSNSVALHSLCGGI